MSQPWGTCRSCANSERRAEALGVKRARPTTHYGVNEPQALAAAGCPSRECAPLPVVADMAQVAGLRLLQGREHDEHLVVLL